MGDDLVVRSVEGEAAELLAAHRVAADDALVAEVLASPLGLAIPDLAGDARVPAGDVLVAQAGFAGYVGAPVVSADGDVRGVLDVYDRRPRTWRPDEVDAVAALASSAAVALRNALLYERVAAEKEKGEAILGQIADGDRRGRRRRARDRVEPDRGRGAAAARSAARWAAACSELLRSEFGDADGAAHAALEAGRRARADRGPAGARRAGALAVGHRGAAAHAGRGRSRAASTPCATSPRSASSTRSSPTSWPPSRTSCARR